MYVGGESVQEMLPKGEAGERRGMGVAHERKTWRQGGSKRLDICSEQAESDSMSMLGDMSLKRYRRERRRARGRYSVKRVCAGGSAFEPYMHTE